MVPIARLQEQPGDLRHYIIGADLAVVFVPLEIQAHHGVWNVDDLFRNARAGDDHFVEFVQLRGVRENEERIRRSGLLGESRISNEQEDGKEQSEASNISSHRSALSGYIAKL